MIRELVWQISWVHCNECIYIINENEKLWISYGNDTAVCGMAKVEGKVVPVLN
jgi:hypothetical protein